MPAALRLPPKQPHNLSNPPEHLAAQRFWVRRGEQSFSLFETVIAVGMLAVVFLYVSGIQGQVIYSLEYSQKLSTGLWIARGLMSKIEHEWDTEDFSQMDRDTKEESIDERDFGSDARKALEGYTYAISIKEWELPLLSFLTGEDSSIEDGSGDMITQQINAIFNGHMMKLAKVEVFWPEGALRASTSLTTLLVNQKAVDQQIIVLKSPADSKSSPSPPDSDPAQQFTSSPRGASSSSPSSQGP